MVLASSSRPTSEALRRAWSAAATVGWSTALIEFTAKSAKPGDLRPEGIAVTAYFDGGIYGGHGAQAFRLQLLTATGLPPTQRPEPDPKKIGLDDGASA